MSLEPNLIWTINTNHFFIFVKSLVPPELSMKLCTPIQCNFFKDWLWFSAFPFLSFPLKKIYLQLLPNLPMKSRLNSKWNCKFIEKFWAKLSAKIWKSKINTEAQLMAWKILHCKLPVGSQLKYIMVNPINCPFCKKSEDMRHIFWGCSFAKKLWNSIFHYLPAIFWHNLN